MGTFARIMFNICPFDHPAITNHTGRFHQPVDSHGCEQEGQHKSRHLYTTQDHCSPKLVLFGGMVPTANVETVWSLTC